MRKLLIRLIPALAFLICTSAHAADYRIATVDLGRVFTNYWKTKQAQVALDQKQSDFDKAEKEKVLKRDLAPYVNQCTDALEKAQANAQRAKSGN